MVDIVIRDLERQADQGDFQALEKLIAAKDRTTGRTLEIISMAETTISFRTAITSFLDTKSDNTIDGYQRDLMDFANFLRIPTLGRGFNYGVAALAAEKLYTLSAAQAHLLVTSYRASLLKLERAPKTIDRRISTLRSLGKICRTLGLCSFSLEIANISGDVVRDTKGPEEDGVKRMLRVLANRFRKGNYQEKRKALRDRAILRLMYDRGFRKDDVVQLNTGRIALAKRIAWVQRKGRKQLEPITLAPGTLAVVKAWMDVRNGSKDPEIRKREPLFVGITKRSGSGEEVPRIDPKTVYNVIRGLGKEAGLRTWPHALRHAAGTEALNKTNGDIRAVAKFLGHKSPTTTMIYDDNRRDLGGEISKKLVEGLDES